MTTTTAGALRGADLDRLLQRDGFVKITLFDAARAAELRAEYGRIHGWDGEGFVNDADLADLDLRSQADEVLAKALDQDVAGRFTGHRVAARAFLAKHPGPTSEVAPRQEWCFVDEVLGLRSYVVWVALEDIDGDNGQLRVLRGSHQIDDSPRGTDLVAPWLRHDDVIRDRLLSVPLQAGEAVVFDAALVHASYPNHTDLPRVAAAAVVVPADAQLIHFRRVDGSHGARYEVDDAFFRTHTPASLLTHAPDAEPAAVAPVPELDLTADELASRLDQGIHARIDRVQHAATQVAQRAAALPDQGKELWRRAKVRRAERAARPDAPPPMKERAAKAWADLPSNAAMAVLAANEAVIDRFGPDTPAVWDPDQFAWSATIEAGYPAVRREVEALLTGPTEIPHIEDVTGGIPQGNVGPWRSFVLMHQGRWIDWNCERCPETTKLVKQVPGLTMAGFSVLEPGTHITEHRGPNKGALRHQLGVIVPGQEGDCRIRVGSEMLHWREGESVMFDFTFPHEAWNDSDAIRVLLMLEVVTPLPWYLDKPNRLAQHAMGWFPTTRDIANRLKKLEPTLQRQAS